MQAYPVSVLLHDVLNDHQDVLELLLVEIPLLLELLRMDLGDAVVLAESFDDDDVLERFEEVLEFGVAQVGEVNVQIHFLLEKLRNLGEGNALWVFHEDLDERLLDHLDFVVEGVGVGVAVLLVLDEDGFVVFDEALVDCLLDEHGELSEGALLELLGPEEFD